MFLAVAERLIFSCSSPLLVVTLSLSSSPLVGLDGGAGTGLALDSIAFSERAARVRFHGDGPLLGVQGTGKAMEVFRVRGEAQAKKKMKR